MGDLSRRVLLHVVKLTNKRGSASISDIAAHSRSSRTLVRKLLDSLDIPCKEDLVSASPQKRVQMALRVGRDGSLTEAASALDWREFESFAEEILRRAGYDAQKDWRFQHQARSWQVDIVAKREDVILCIDCKHWNTPYYPSKFDTAVQHQLTATQAIVQKLSEEMNRPAFGLPVILTLREPRQKLRKDVVTLSISQFPTFLVELCQHLQELPLIVGNSPAVENPIKVYQS